MAILGKYQPKYETSIASIAKQHPIASTVTLGAVPLVGSLAGGILETGRAMFSDTGDPLAMVQGRTRQVASELSDYANGKAGKPTVSAAPIASPQQPMAPPVSTTAIEPITTIGNVGLIKLTQKDLSRMSDGQLPSVMMTTPPAPPPPAPRPAYGITKDAQGNPLLYGKGEPQAASQPGSIAAPVYQQSQLPDIPLRRTPQGRPGLSDRSLASFIDSTIADGNWMRNQADVERNQAANESLLDKARKDQIAQDANKNSFNSGIYQASGSIANNLSQAKERDFLAPTIATKNLADAAEAQQRIKALLAPAVAKGSLTQKDIMDGAHSDAFKTATERIKQSMAVDPVERQKEFDRYYHDARLKFLNTYKQMTAGDAQ